MTSDKNSLIRNAYLSYFNVSGKLPAAHCRNNYAQSINNAYTFFDHPSIWENQYGSGKTCAFPKSMNT